MPLVELKTVNDVRYYTDSNGLIAYREPGLMGERVFFHVSSPGYESPKNGFGMRAVVLTPQAGKSAQIKLTRLNIAERLYRVTGQGIYADTLLLGRKAPIEHPALNSRVMGQDSVLAVPYRGKIYWFWGDTSQAASPLGNFGTSGATSLLPDAGGLDPSRGVDLTYFTSENGFSRPMVPLGKPGLVWSAGITVVKDTSGRERMFGSYMRLKDMTTIHERGIMEFDDATQTFKPVRTLDAKARLLPSGQAFHVTHDGTAYVYFAIPYPLLRVRADPQALTDPASYEAFTCLKPGARYNKDNPELDRDAEADAPHGPWNWARKVATHPDYSFYNVCHHPFFDQEDGRLIYFEGTYTAEFSGAKFHTPRYNYNQIMYRLDLADPRLALP